MTVAASTNAQVNGFGVIDRTGSRRVVKETT
jgi:hypothetical protein